jgi:hypothetical protein
MDQEVIERVGTLEIILGEFLVRTEKMLRRMEQDTKALKEEMSEFKGEMSDFKDEMSEFKEEMRQDRKDLNKKWGELANRLGTIAEDIAAPNVRTVATTLFGCTDIDSYSVRVMRRSWKDRTRLTEFDVVITGGNYLFINETKANPQAEYVSEFAEKLKDIFDFLPEYQEKTVVPIFSSLHLPEPIVQLLTKHKIYAMALGGETMELLNYDAVKQQ